MPHLSIEFTNNLDAESIGQCLADANEALAASGHFDEADIKSRARPTSLFRVGTHPEGRAFVAATLSLLSGRDEETRRDLAERVLRAMSQSFPGRTGLSVQFSVEVTEIGRATYAKSVSGA